MRGPVETYRGAAEGFLGSTGGTAALPSGVTGVFGDANNYPVVTLTDGAVSAASTQPRTSGATAVVGSATVYPSLSVTNGNVTATATFPARVGVTGTYGSAFTFPILTTVNGEVTAASSNVVKTSCVVWRALTGGAAYAADAPILWQAVSFDTLDVITQTVVGTTLTLQFTGLYLVSFLGFATGPVQSTFYVNGTRVPGGLQNTASQALHVCYTLTLSAGDAITVGCTSNWTSSGFKYVAIVRLQ